MVGAWAVMPDGSVVRCGWSEGVERNGLVLLEWCKLGPLSLGFR